METMKMTGPCMTRGDVLSAQITMPTLASVGGGFQGTGVSTPVAIKARIRDRAVAVRVDVVDYPSTHKFANGVSRSAPDRPPV